MSRLIDIINILRPDPGQFVVINKILRKSNLFLICFFIFKLFLIFFYLLGGLQSFTVSSIRLILRIIMSNDILIILFSILNVVTSRNINRRYSMNLSIMTFSIFNFFFSIFTLVITFAVIVFSY